jgi:hypothetical protein
MIQYVSLNYSDNVETWIQSLRQLCRQKARAAEAEGLARNFNMNVLACSIWSRGLPRRTTSITYQVGSKLETQ